MDYPKIKFECGCIHPRKVVKQKQWLTTEGVWRRKLVCPDHERSMGVSKIRMCECGKEFETLLRSRNIRCLKCTALIRPIQAEAYRRRRGVKEAIQRETLQRGPIDFAKIIKINNLKRNDMSPCGQGCNVYEENGNEYNDEICPWCDYRVAYARGGA